MSSVVDLVMILMKIEILSLVKKKKKRDNQIVDVSVEMVSARIPKITSHPRGEEDRKIGGGVKTKDCS